MNAKRSNGHRQILPGEMPTIEPPPPSAAPGVMPTIEPPDCPSISSNSPVSMASGVILLASAVNSHLPSLPATDHGRGFGATNGVFNIPLTTLTTLFSISKLLIESLLGERLVSEFNAGGCSRW